MEIYTQLPKDLKREIASNVGDPRKFAALLDLDPDLIHVFNQDQLDVIKHMVESGKTVSSWPGVSLLNSSYILIKRLISLGVYFRNGKNNVKLYQANLNSCLRKTLPNPIGAAIQVYSCNSDLMDQN